MAKKDPKSSTESAFTIYDRVQRQRIPVSEDFYKIYARDVDTYRHRQQDRGFCKCPRYEWRYCNTDCLTCTYYTAGGDAYLSLDALNGDNGVGDSESSLLDALTLESPDVADVVANTMRLRELIADLADIMPEAIEYGHSRLQGNNKGDSARKTGLAVSTFNDRLKRAKEILQVKYPDIEL